MGTPAQATLGVEARIQTQIGMLLALWEGVDNSAKQNETIPQNAEKILDVAAAWTSPDQVSSCRAAVAAGDPRALVALNEIANVLKITCAKLIARCDSKRRSGEWQAVLQLARLAGGAADTFGMATELAHSREHEATALRNLGNDAAAIDAYRSAIAAARSSGDEPFLARAHESLADTLDEVLKFEEARRHYTRAGELNKDPGRQWQIMRKRAIERIHLGEFKSGAAELSGLVDQMKKTGLSGVELARNLDMAAQAMLAGNDYETALSMLKQARENFPPDAQEDLAGNFQIDALVAHSAGRDAEAAQSIKQAYDLAVSVACSQIDPQHYRKGFQAALATSLPVGDEAVQLFRQGIVAQAQGQAEAAFDRWQRAANRAYQSKDYRLWLRIQANVVSFFADRGMTDQAIELAVRTFGQARERGLARPECMALTTAAMLEVSGAAVPESSGWLMSFARAKVLLDMHAAMMAEFQLSPEERTFEIQDDGQIDNELALLFQRNGADRLAAEHFRNAIEKARKNGLMNQLVNRLCGLRSVLTTAEDLQQRKATTDEIRLLINSVNLQPRGKLVGLNAIADEDAPLNRASAITLLTQASQVMEAYRRTNPLADRADYDRDFSDIPGRLAALLRRENRNEEAFDALQLVKGRRLIDALVSRESHPTEKQDEPLTAKELRTLLPKAGPNTIVVDLAIEPDQRTIAAYLIDDREVRAASVSGDLSSFDRGLKGDVTEREAALVSMCRHSALLRSLAEAIVAAIPGGSNLMLVPDRFLHHLPLHAIPVGGQAWAEVTPITYTPTAAILRFSQSGLPSPHALIAGDSHGDLEGAAAECSTIGAYLGSKPLLGRDCTRAAIEKSLREDRPDIVHLAVHGRSDANLGQRSAILVADGKGDVEWLDFRSLRELPWCARLVVFSGCGTGVLGLLHGTQLVSTAEAALEAGAATVIASLWPVNDEYARSFMSAFYSGLVKARSAGPVVDLRQLVEEARRSLRAQFLTTAQTQRRDGRQFGDEDETPDPQSAIVNDPDVDQALAWAPFCLFGKPVLDAPAGANL